MEIEGLLVPPYYNPNIAYSSLPLSGLLPGRPLLNSRSQLPLPALHQFGISSSPRPPVFSGWDKEDIICIGSMGRH